MNRKSKIAVGSYIKFFVWILLILSVIFGLLIFAPLAFGLKPYKITSSSMSPVLNVGDLIYVKKASSTTLRVNDIITFHQQGSDVIVTHRIHRIDKKSGLIYTIGDRNKDEDVAPTAYKDIIGVYVDWKIPWIGGFKN